MRHQKLNKHKLKAYFQISLKGYFVESKKLI